MTFFESSWLSKSNLVHNQVHPQGGQSCGLSQGQLKVNEAAGYYRAFCLKVWYLCQIENKVKVWPLSVVTFWLVMDRGRQQGTIVTSVSLNYATTQLNCSRTFFLQKRATEVFTGLCGVSLDLGILGQHTEHSFIYLYFSTSLSSPCPHPYLKIASFPLL